jgi:adenosylcobinamide-phosphate synthase
VVYAVLLVLGVTGLSARLTRRSTVLSAAAVWASLGGRSLERAARRIGRELECSNVEEARLLAPALVGRDPRALGVDELCRAVVESVAENTNDAVVGPLLWAAVGGAPGACAYRAINTLDSMVGHKHDRHLHFGWFSARLDDVASWPSARLTALLAVALAPMVGGSSRDAWRAAWHDGREHPSPNAGRVEGAFAGALGVRLGGVNVYAHGRERRPTLGHGRPPRIGDIDRAVALARLVAAAAVVLALCGARR